MKAFDRVLTTFGILLLLSFRADAHDPSMAHHEWFNAQEMNPAARDRLGVPWKSCCDNGDVFKTRFRVGEDRSDQWQYLKNGEWKTIPPDIIKEGDTPDHTPCCSSTNTREWSFASLYRKEVSDERPRPDPAPESCEGATGLEGRMSSLQNKIRGKRWVVLNRKSRLRGPVPTLRGSTATRPSR